MCSLLKGELNYVDHYLVTFVAVWLRIWKYPSYSHFSLLVRRGVVNKVMTSGLMTQVSTSVPVSHDSSRTG